MKASISDRFIKFAQNVLPSPFTIAVLLTLLSILLALLFTEGTPENVHLIEILGFWESGFFDFLKFAMQMMLILVLGHVLALTPPLKKTIDLLVRQCNNTANSAALVCFISIILAFFNWGLALVLGAIFAREVGLHASRNRIPINYPLIGAAGYSGLMVWHGGISGSAPLTVAESDHKFVDQIGVLPFSETIFSTMNLSCMALLLILLPLFMYFMGKKGHSNVINLSNIIAEDDKDTQPSNHAEKLDHSRFLAYLVASMVLFIGFYKIFSPLLEGKSFDWSFRFINPNYIIFIFYGLGLLLHGSIHKFNEAVSKGIGGSAGIMIQFPLYAGIMGIMIQSGLVNVFSDAFTSISNQSTFPILTFISAGVVNIFVPSGGGQWLVQGPILIEASQALNIPMGKSVMALCYGDQITNMLQPFWALPLLGITGLKAKEILPYTFYLMLMGIVIYCSILMLF